MKHARKVAARAERTVSGPQGGNAPFSQVGSHLGGLSFGKYRAVLDAATRAFTTQGFAKTSMDAIAEMAQVSKRTVYNHFGTKEALYAAVVQLVCANIMPPSLESLHIEMNPPEEVLRQLGMRFLEGIYGHDQIELFRTIATDTRTFPELGALLFDGPVTRSEQTVAQYLEYLTNAGTLRLASPVLAAGQFIGMLKTNLHVRLLLKPGTTVSRQKIKEIVVSSVDLFLNGARAHGRRRAL